VKSQNRNLAYQLQDLKSRMKGTHIHDAGNVMDCMIDLCDLCEKLACKLAELTTEISGDGRAVSK